MSHILDLPSTPHWVEPTPASAENVWRVQLSFLLEKGNVVTSAGRKTRENVPLWTTVDATLPLVSSPRRKLGLRFAAAEAAWILSGDDQVASIAPYARGMTHYSDDGERFFGAYGPKLVAQWEHCLDELVRDPGSRRAVVNIWRENPPTTKDYPCTLSYQFLLRGNTLELVCSMRSSDAWLGWPYDTFTRSMILQAMAIDLRNRTGNDVGVGSVFCVAGSGHLYEDDAAKALYVLHDRLATPVIPIHAVAAVDGVEELVEELWAVARLKEWDPDAFKIDGLREMHRKLTSAKE